MNYGIGEEEDDLENEDPVYNPSTHPSEDSFETYGYGLGITEFPDVMNLSLN